MKAMSQISEDIIALNPDYADLLRKTKQIRIKADDPPARSDGFRSQLEADYAVQLTLRGFKWRYEPFTLHLPGGVDYTPDFIAWVGEHAPRLIECKGSKKMKNARDSLTRYKIASGLLPCFYWVWVEYADGEWQEKYF